MPLSDKDKCLARLYMAACFHHWELLPGSPLLKWPGMLGVCCNRPQVTLLHRVSD